MARQLDPFSISNTLYAGAIYFMAGQFDDAANAERGVLELARAPCALLVGILVRTEGDVPAGGQLA